MGREQIRHDGVVRLSCPAFCKWLCNSWDPLQHRACVSWGTCLVTGYSVLYAHMSPTQKAAALLPRHSRVRWVSHERRACSPLVPWLQFQPGENTKVIAAVSARREVVSSQVMLRLLHLPEEKKRVPLRQLLGSPSRLLAGPASPGFSQQCAQWDTARQLASRTGWRVIHTHTLT